MQTDFHHAVTYVSARTAGFDHAQADIIAYSAQYVDDAVSEGVVHFDNDAFYARIHSSHKSTDVGNLNNDYNHLIWLPFHFLPGNGGKGPGEDPDGSFIQKIVCLPDSPPAKEMVQAAVNDKGKPYSLHRLGIALHVYADTWSHQGFAGVIHDINEVEHAREIKSSGMYAKQLQHMLEDWLDDVIPPLGHGRAKMFPDLPFLHWQYKNGGGVWVERDNPTDFCKAADAMCKAMQQYLNKPPSGLPAADKALLNKIFLELKIKEDKARHDRWLDIVKSGFNGERFSFGGAEISYVAEGVGSWKEKALGSSWDLRVHPYKPGFLSSDWKLFHDALQLHRLTVLHDILPKYGICAG
ncbi:DUF6765 family protein [Methylomonas methanica]|uniref:Uncharacterized protein n=1 Tax=Methylomonas methanica TaxID=421 RepID=A0A177MRJ9_METMH|nr:DUF6765 family protein [Methylomonas methanica]OAI08004.1 hypothetical protein A1332_01000 [Methylomonas methanica]